MPRFRSVAWTVSLVALALASSCRLGESLDDFTNGSGGTTPSKGGSGGSGGTGGGGGAGGAGGTNTGGTAGAAGFAGKFVACEATPAVCEDVADDTASRLFGCCDGNTAYWCDSGSTLRQENCDTTAKTCGYSPGVNAMRCTQGAGGSGGSTACESGACTGPCANCETSSPDCETDTNTDPEHCGACGHSCLGGTCSGGTCQVVVLAANQKTPWGIAVDAVAAYWVVEAPPAPDQGLVFSVPIGGGSANQLADGQNGPVQIAQDGEYVFWTNFQGGGSVRRVRKDGTDLINLAQASGAWALALGSSHVYWTNTSDGSIRRIVKTGGQATVLLTGESNPRGIAVDASYIYWTNFGSGQVRSANPDGTSPTTVATNQDNPLGIAVAGGWIYWTEVGASYALGDCASADGRVVRASSPDGQNLELLAENQACPMNLVIADDTVFWTNAGTVTGSVYNYDGTVQQMSTDGTNVKAVATGQDRPYGVAVTGEAVYWTNQGVFASKGSVAKIAR